MSLSQGTFSNFSKLFPFFTTMFMEKRLCGYGVVVVNLKKNQMFFFLSSWINLESYVVALKIVLSRKAGVVKIPIL